MQQAVMSFVEAPAEMLLQFHHPAMFLFARGELVVGGGLENPPGLGQPGLDRLRMRSRE